MATEELQATLWYLILSPLSGSEVPDSLPSTLPANFSINIIQLNEVISVSLVPLSLAFLLVDLLTPSKL